MTSHRSQKEKFMKGLLYAQRCADQFNNRLRRFEDDSLLATNRLMSERCQMLQHQVKGRCEDIAHRQNKLMQLWTKRNEEMGACNKACLLEVLSKQIIDRFGAKDVEFRNELPRKPLQSMSTAELEAFLDIIIRFERLRKVTLIMLFHV
jgi:hypothetical protein